MPGDVQGMDARLARPKTSPGAISSNPNEKSPEGSEDGEEYHVELLEYEWPDLPPIPHMKDAITRKTVSRGISYLLPVDKAKNSINNQYRTDLRAMFQEPYSEENVLGFDEGRVKLSAKVHFDKNSSDTKWSQKHLSTVPLSLNSESEKIRKLYARSAPAGGSRGAGFNVEKMRTRSSLYLPMKTKAHPEALKLRKEVEEMVKSVQLRDEDNDYNDNMYKEKTPDDTQGAPGHDAMHRQSIVSHRQSVANVKYRHSEGHVKSRQSAGNLSVAGSHYSKPTKLRLTAEKFSTYDQLKKTKPPKPTIPEVFRSQYLSHVKNQEIWEWLHYGEEMTEFEYFLSVCG